MVREYGLRVSLYVMALVFLIPACSSKEALPASDDSISSGEAVVVKSADGALTLEIPAGAIAGDAEIQISALTETEVAELLQGEPGAPVGYRLEPAGLEFSEPVGVTLSFDSEDPTVASGEGLSPYVILIFDEDGQAEVLPEQVTEVTLGQTEITVRANLQHFSFITAVRHGLTLSFSPGPSEALVGDVFEVQAKVSNQSKVTVFKGVEGEFHEFTPDDAVEVPGTLKIGPYDLFEGDEISERQFVHCSKEGSGDYGIMISTPTLQTLPYVQGQGGYAYTTMFIMAWVECVTTPSTLVPVTGDPVLDAMIDLFPGSMEEIVGAIQLADSEQDWIYEIQAEEALLKEPSVDILKVFAGVFDLSEEAKKKAFGNTLFECGTEVEGRLTICPDNALPFPAGEMVMLGMVLGDDVPLSDPDHFYFYTATFDSDGDTANNYVIFEPYNWDLLQGGDRWYSLEWYPEDGRWTAITSKTEGEFQELIAGAFRVVIDRNLIVFFIPVSEFEVARPGFRLTSFVSGGTFEAADSGGDVIGADPTEPLLQLPEEAVPIESLED